MKDALYFSSEPSVFLGLCPQVNYFGNLRAICLVIFFKVGEKWRGREIFLVSPVVAIFFFFLKHHSVESEQLKNSRIQGQIHTG